MTPDEAVEAMKALMEQVEARLRSMPEDRARAIMKRFFAEIFGDEPLPGEKLE